MWIGDAGERERAAEADPERDHAHVLEARVGEQPLPRLRPPEERDRDGERDEPEADEHAARRAHADRRCERLLRAPGDEQHGGEERSREECRDGRGRLGVRVGQPVVHGRPADLGGEAGEQQDVGDDRRLGIERGVGERAPGERSRCPPPPAADSSMRIPSSATPRPSEVRMRYFQPASSARARPLKPTSSAEAAVVASIASQAAPRFPASGTASSTAQNAKSVAQ